MIDGINPVIFNADDLDEFFKARLDEIEHIFEVAMQKPKEILEKFSQFTYILDMSDKEILKKLFGEMKEKPDIQDLKLSDFTT